MKTKVVFSSKAILRESDISRVSVNNDQIQELITLANICQMSLEYSIFFRSQKYTLWNLESEFSNNGHMGIMASIEGREGKGESPKIIMGVLVRKFKKMLLKIGTRILFL